MRPRKTILCVDGNELNLSVRTFMLFTNGYRVLSATTGQEALLHFSGVEVDVVLAVATPQMNAVQLVDQLKDIAPHMPMILLADPWRVEAVHHADVMLPKKCLPAELLGRIRIMSARKRGPRKGVARAEPPLTYPAAIAAG